MKVKIVKPHIGLIPTFNLSYVILDMVPSSSEDITRALRRLFTKRPKMKRQEM